MTAPQRPSLHGAIGTLVQAAAAERPQWADAAIADIHRAMTDSFWYDGLPKLQQQQIWAKREALIARGFLDQTTDTEGDAA